MTGTSIVMSKRDMDDLAELGNALLSTGWFTDVGKVAQAAIKVLAGRELGLGPVESMRQLHIVEQRIELSADLLAQRVKLHPRYDYRVLRVDEEACEIRFFQDGEAIGVSKFDIGDATVAGLVSRDNWKRYPRQMLFNRAMSQGVKFFVPDIAATWQYEVSSEIEPDVGSAQDRSSPVGMVEDEGSEAEANTRSTGADASDPTRESLAYGEGAGGSEGEEEGPPSSSPDNRALSTQTTQLLRHAAELRWNDDDIAAALEDAYPGMRSLRELDQEQARELIRVWAKLAAANRITKEQKDRLKPLATPAERVAAAQLLFGADHIRTVSDMTIAEADAVIEHLEKVRAEQAVTA